MCAARFASLITVVGRWAAILFYVSVCVSVCLCVSLCVSVCVFAAQHQDERKERVRRMTLVESKVCAHACLCLCACIEKRPC